MDDLNTSGIYPVGDRILVKPDLIPKKAGKDSLIELPDTVRDRHGTAQVAGVLVAAGPEAWSDRDGPYAKVGGRVLYAKYHGNTVMGKDGETYRLLNDIDITAVIDPDLDFNEFQGRISMKESA